MRTRSLALSTEFSRRPPYCSRGVAPITAIERGWSILCMAAIWLVVQNSSPAASDDGVLLAGGDGGMATMAVERFVPGLDGVPCCDSHKGVARAVSRPWQYRSFGLSNRVRLLGNGQPRIRPERR